MQSRMRGCIPGATQATFMYSVVAWSTVMSLCACRNDTLCETGDITYFRGTRAKPSTAYMKSNMNYLSHFCTTCLYSVMACCTAVCLCIYSNKHWGEREDNMCCRVPNIKHNTSCIQSKMYNLSCDMVPCYLYVAPAAASLG